MTEQDYNSSFLTSVLVRFMHPNAENKIKMFLNFPKLVICETQADSWVLFFVFFFCHQFIALVTQEIFIPSIMLGPRDKAIFQVAYSLVKANLAVLFYIH